MDTYVGPDWASVGDSEVPGRELGGVISDGHTNEIQLDRHVRGRETWKAHNPESKPVVPLALRGRQGSANEDWVTVWFFWWLLKKK